MSERTSTTSKKARTFLLPARLAMAADIIDNLLGCEVLKIEITPEYAKALLARREIFSKAARADKDAWEIYFWDASGEYYSREWDFAEKAGKGHPKDEDGEPIITTGEPHRTECDQCVVRESGVSWTTIPKHSSLYVVTDEVPWGKIVEIARVAHD